MMVTNLCTSPSSTITLRAGTWMPITTVPNVNGAKYWVSAYVNFTGGTISVYGINLSASQRVSYQITAVNSGVMSMNYSVVSGNPMTVTVTDMLICTLAEYQANKTLLDSIGYFDGDTMSRA